MRLKISLRRQLSDNIDTSNFKPKKLDIDYLQTVLTAASTQENLPGLCKNNLPPLLFRWSNFDSQGINCKTELRAGLFENTGSLIFNPGDISQEFLEHFKNHATKAKLKTPFISTSQAPISPVHRGIRAGKGAILTIIDTSKLDTPIFTAQELVKLTDTRTPCYRGYGEFLVWGRVPTPAIVSTIYIDTLKELVAGHPEIEYLLQFSLFQSRKACNNGFIADLTKREIPKHQAGCILGKLLEILEIPVPHRENVARASVQRWHWSQKRLSEFLQGIQDCSTVDIDELERPDEMPYTPQNTPPQKKQKEIEEETMDSDYDYELSEDEDSDSESYEFDDSKESSHGSWMPFRHRPETPSDGYFSVHDTVTVCSGPVPTAEDRLSLPAWDVPPMPYNEQLRTPNQGSSRFLNGIPGSRPETPIVIDAENDSLNIVTADDWPSESEAVLDTPTRRPTRYSRNRPLR
ncbi:hypothetical protein NUU61_005186 [Penicillium alfredii]|uniref:DUF7587 domain-containing protein n=1 Tax=Penicillium alfredii TaxID=1506179 RepID=A0A9W9F961_9EURO|nr:uncharacterized protein NUU61_005186 [Penicillium alfredii]KAJ5095830.1 hypothetical protein NUU61_005186 [Penicillium alfredii]